MSFNRILQFPMYILPILALTACTVSSGSSGSVRTDFESSLPDYSGPRASIRLADFRMGDEQSSSSQIVFEGPDGQTQTVSWGVTEQRATANGLQVLLKQAMLKSKRFRVTAREETFDTLKDEVTENGDWVREDEQAEKGQVLGADLVVNAIVTTWEPNAGGREVGGGILGKILPIPGAGAVKVGNKKSKVGLVMEIVDLNTQELLASVTAEGVGTSTNFGLAGLGWGSSAIAGGWMKSYENTPMQDAVAKAIFAAVDGLVAEIPEHYYRF